MCQAMLVSVGRISPSHTLELGPLMQNRETSRDSPCTLSGPVCNFVGKEKVITIYLAYNEFTQDIQRFKKNWVIIEMSPAFPVAHL